MFYIMNTKTKTPTTTPWDNKFGHSSTDVTFLYLQSGKSVKVVATYGGTDAAIGSYLPVTQDTGMGHRWMADHYVVAVVDKDGVRGTLPTAKALPFWVTK